MNYKIKDLDPYQIPGISNVARSIEDYRFDNNIAMQQMWEDIRRTYIVRLDQLLVLLRKRINYEITPENVNEVLSYLKYARLFTGDEAFQEDIDEEFIINIDTLFPANQAEQLKAAIGKTIWMVVYIPTHITMAGDQSLWDKRVAARIVDAFFRIYGISKVDYGPEFTAKYPNFLELVTIINAYQANKLEKLCFCNMADIVQTSRIKPERPEEILLQVACATNVLYQIWADDFKLNGVGPTKYDAIRTYFNSNFKSNFISCFFYGLDYALNKYYKLDTANTIDSVVKDISEEITKNGLEFSENHPTAIGDSCDSINNSMTIAIAAGCITSMATRNSNAGLTALNLSINSQKKTQGRLEFYGDAQQDQSGITDISSIESDKGCICELTEQNFSEYVRNVGHSGGYAAIIAAAHADYYYAEKEDAFCLNPLIKIAFASNLFNFNFADPIGEFNGSNNEKTILQIQKNAENTYQQLKGTPAEGIAVAIRQETEKLDPKEIDPKKIQKYIKNMIEIIRLKIPQNEIQDYIDKIVNETDIGKKLEGIIQIIALIPQRIGDHITEIKIESVTIINRSLLINSFNKVKKEHNEEVAKALEQIGEFIEKSGEVSAGILFDKFNEELTKPQADKSTLRRIWNGIEKTLPSIARISDIVAKLAPLL